MVCIIWLCITVVVFVISFSIIVSCIFVSLLLVTVGILYNRAGSSTNVASSILLDGKNISFYASLVWCMRAKRKVVNSTSCSYVG
jgi:hypothetical protein